MRLPRRLQLFGALALIYAAAAANGAETSPPPLRLLTTVAEAHELPTAEAARAYPVHIRGVVTYYDPYIDLIYYGFFIHDATGDIHVLLPARTNLPLRPGSVVDVWGVTTPGVYCPGVVSSSFRIVSQSHLPDNPLKATVPELFTGSLDAKWVEIEGRVHAVHLEPQYAFFEIGAIGATISAVTLREPGADYDSLVDALIRVRGNAVPLFKPNMQMFGARLLFPSLREVKVLQVAVHDPYAAPTLPINYLLRYTPKLEPLHQVHLRGTLTLLWPDRLLCIQQGSDGLCMKTEGSAKVSPGDLVDVLGFPAIGDYKATLENATFRLAGRSSSPTHAELVTAEQAFQENRDQKIVQVEGELIGQNRAAGDLTLMLRSGQLLFPAILPKEAVGPGTHSWKEGSILRLTGICSVQMSKKSVYGVAKFVQLESFKILLRSTDDVQVLHAPSWWTSTRAVRAIAITLAAAIAFLIWIVVLRHTVEQRTQELKSSEERFRHLSQHDSLTGLPNRFLLNDRMEMALKRAIRSETPLGVLMVDLDFFKEINDMHGHHAGDKLLCEVADRLLSAVRASDTVARYGGDEFIILLPDLRSANEADAIAAKIITALASPIDIGVATINATLSLGVCTYPDAGTTIESLLRCADAALYRAKANGRNGFEVYVGDREQTMP